MSRFFGQVAQVAYVVRDLDSALDHWIKLGVGPWFRGEVLDYFRYRGAEADAHLGLALANSGDVQLELIQPLNDAPSAWKDFLDAGDEGVHHLAYWPSDYRSACDRARSLGIGVLQEGSASGVPYCYLDTQFVPGTVIELFDGAKSKEVNDQIRAAAVGWDGTDPIRDLAQLIRSRRAPAATGTASMH